METPFNKILSITLLLMVLGVSCRKEEIISIQEPADKVLVANSTIALQMKNTTSNDGSNDNIIDKSNCFNIKFPFSVTVNGTQITVNSDDDYKIIEFIFDDSDDDIDILSITYPITIILDDFTEITINNDSELRSYSIKCNGEDEADDDIECLDFQYPITGSLFNKDNEIIDTVSFNSDNDLNDFLKYLNTSYYVTLSFPINVTLLDGTMIAISNLDELYSTILTHKNDCDEDDDYDYNDDDCNDCNIDQLALLLTSCSDWTIDKLERYSYDYDTYYDGYNFNFFNDGTISATEGGYTYFGTWAPSGSGNNLVVVINITNLPYCNNNWVLHEISQYSNSKIDLRVGESDRMRYKNNCN